MTYKELKQLELLLLKLANWDCVSNDAKLHATVILNNVKSLQIAMKGREN